MAISGEVQGKCVASAACLISSCMPQPWDQGKRQAWLGLLLLIWGLPWLRVLWLI